MNKTRWLTRDAKRLRNATWMAIVLDQLGRISEHFTHYDKAFKNKSYKTSVKSSLAVTTMF